MNGGSAPRVHTMDEYFITEVEKEVRTTGGHSSSKALHTFLVATRVSYRNLNLNGGLLYLPSVIRHCLNCVQEVII